MKMLFGLVVTLLMMTGGFTSHAETQTMQLEEIKLQHKPVDDIIPLVEPFLPENAVISGEGYKIILKTTAANMPQVKQLIADLDTPLQQLHISVSLDPAVLTQDVTKSAPSTGSEAHEKLKASTTSPADTSGIYKTKGRETTAGIQVIQVLQDRWSIIRTGQAIPVVTRVRNPDGTITESISYQQVNQGLRIHPHLGGDEVVLGVQPFYEAASQSGTGQQLYYGKQKQAKARLGNWISIDTATGSLLPSGSQPQPDPSTSATTSLIYLKIDVAP